MNAVELDPEVKGRVLEFICEREGVTVEDVRREFFPDEIGVPYLYLDRLTAEGSAYSISPDHEPTQWFSALGRRERRSASLKRRRAKAEAKREHRAKDQVKRERQAREVATEEPSTDPELLDWVRDFIFQHETVTRAGVEEEFFPGEYHTAQRYLSALESEGAIESPDDGQTYEWAYPETSPEAKTRSERRVASHAGCTHSMTSGERAKCRREQGIPFLIGNQPRGHIYYQFTDGETHQLTAEQIKEIHGGTVDQFASCLRSYATNHAMKCSARKSESGLTFRFSDVRPTGTDVMDFLPRVVVVKDLTMGEPKKATTSNLVRALKGDSAHKDCTHPRTSWDRAKCRKARAEKAAA